jgi:hypothetical protein
LQQQTCCTTAVPDPASSCVQKARDPLLLRRKLEEVLPAAQTQFGGVAAPHSVDFQHHVILCSAAGTRLDNASLDVAVSASGCQNERISHACQRRALCKSTACEGTHCLACRSPPPVDISVITQPTTLSSGPVASTYVLPMLKPICLLIHRRLKAM